MKKNILYVLTLGLLITGCSTIKNSSSASSLSSSIINVSNSSIESQLSTSDNNNDNNEERAMKEFIQSEGYSYVEKINNYGFYEFNKNELDKTLQEPSTEITSIKELVKLLDYCAFYHIDKIDITSSLSEFETSFNKAYWNTSLLPGTVGVNYEKKESSYSIEFFYADPAKFTFISSCIPSITPYKFPSLYSYSRTQSFEDFPYLSRTKELSVYNSEQLVYALCEGYKPICISNSPAEKVLNEAKNILRDIISPEFESDLDKMVAIYNYITSTVTYDYLGDEQFVYGDNNALFKDEIIASSSSNYVEGAMFDKKAVCHGLAKFMALLVNMEGIESHKISAYSNNNFDPLHSRNPIFDGSYNEHGYCYTKIEEDYFITDPTYAFAGKTIDGITIKRDSSILLNKNDWKKIYSNFDDFFEEVYPTSSSFFGTKISYLEDGYGNKLSLNPTTKDEMEKIITAIEKLITINSSNYSFLFQISSNYLYEFINMFKNASFSNNISFINTICLIESDYGLSVCISC